MDQGGKGEKSVLGRQERKNRDLKEKWEDFFVAFFTGLGRENPERQ